MNNFTSVTSSSNLSLTVKLGHGIINDTLLGVRILDGGIIVSHEVALTCKMSINADVCLLFVDMTR